MVFFRRDGGLEEFSAALDTLVFRPDEGLFTMTWRACMSLRKNIFEVSEVLVGTMSPGWWRARELGKDWYPSLGELSRQSKASEEVA